MRHATFISGNKIDEIFAVRAEQTNLIQNEANSAYSLRKKHAMSTSKHYSSALSTSSASSTSSTLSTSVVYSSKHISCSPSLRLVVGANFRMALPHSSQCLHTMKS